MILETESRSGWLIFRIFFGFERCHYFLKLEQVFTPIRRIEQIYTVATFEGKKTLRRLRRRRRHW